MTISSSLNAGVAGLSANASKLATISDNIANGSTYGYKRAVTDFHSMVIASGDGTYSAGGVRVTSNRMIDQRGSLVSTSNSTDIAVRGRGMIPVSNVSELGVNELPLRMATTGSFRPDDQGYLTTTSGLVLLGWSADETGAIPTQPRDTSDGLVPVQINANEFAGEATTWIDMSVNLPATSTESTSAGDTEELSFEYFDNLGKSQNLSAEFVPTVPLAGASNEWTLVLRDSAQGGAIVGDYTMTFDDVRGAGGTLLSVTDNLGTAPYDPLTGKASIQVDGGPMEIGLGLLGASEGLTQLSDSFTPVSIDKNGTPVGNMTAIEIDQNGYVSAAFDTGVSRVLYQIPLVDVPNINGLESFDNQSYGVTPSSGNVFLWDAGDGPTGEVIGFAQEESATDIAGELTQLITTQRAYSSNAKVIQTVDEMLQETTNIKR